MTRHASCSQGLFAGALALCLGCSVLYDGGSAEPGCRVADGFDPCTFGPDGARRSRVCSSQDGSVGECIACVAAMERCGDLADNDCDGRVDEGGVESCNDLDDDCDGAVDEDAPADTTRAEIGCNRRDDDCDGAIDENAIELCDGLDNDCDGRSDEGAPPDRARVELCNQLDDDCDGRIDETFQEICDLSDNDCDGRIDEGAPIDPARREACNGVDDDCDLAIDEGFEELCDGLDNDCDGQVDNGAAPDPSRTEFCDGVDNDCNGMIDDVDAAERCNQVDDDCDTRVDEGAPADPTRGEECDAIDNDCDGTVDEGAPEQCNGNDDDCDDAIDEEATCPGGQFCEAGACVDEPSCEGEGASCDAGRVCNRLRAPAVCTAPPPSCSAGSCAGADERCTEVRLDGEVFSTCLVPLPFGSPCVLDAQCGEGLSCFEMAAIGGSGRRCLQTCCAQGDCPAGGVCRSHPENGASICVPPEAESVAVGMSCEGGGECASGFCVGGLCRAACSRQEHCAVFGATCVGAESVDGRGFACAATGGAAEQDQSCEMSGAGVDALCRYRMCDEFTTGTFCVEPCSVDDDCPGGEACRVLAVTEETEDGAFSFRTLVRTCRAAGPDYVDSPRRYIRSGRSCPSNDFTCASRYCRDDVCAELCCTTADCGAGEVCEPVRRFDAFWARDRWASYCVPRD